MIRPVLLMLIASLACAAVSSARAQETPVPTPVASPAELPATSPTPAPSPIPTPTPPPDVETLVDSLSPADLQEVVSLLKAEFVQPGRLTDQELARASVQGLLARLGTGASLVMAQTAPPDTPVSFLAEILDERIGYLKLGALSAENVQQLDAALDNLRAKSIQSVVLDLRHTPHSGDFDLALEVIRRFAPQGRLLFSLRKPGAKQERMFTSSQEPRFQGLVMILADADTSGAPEVIAGTLRLQARALVIGEPTAGRAVEYSERRLSGGRILRFAIAEAALPEGAPIYPGGVKPDLPVKLDRTLKQQMARQGADKGISQFVFDKDRPRMNEAALVAGTNPELDSIQSGRRNGESDTPARIPRDTVLQRAVDLITTITLYETKPGKG